MLPLASTAICGFVELAASCDRFCGLEKFAPPSMERLKKISFPAALFTQTTLMWPWLSTAMCGLGTKPELLDIWTGDKNVAPPSCEQLNRIFELLVEMSSSHTTLILPAGSTAVCG